MQLSKHAPIHDELTISQYKVFSQLLCPLLLVGITNAWRSPIRGGTFTFFYHRTFEPRVRYIQLLVKHDVKKCAILVGVVRWLCPQKCACGQGLQKIEPMVSSLVFEGQLRTTRMPQVLRSIKRCQAMHLPKFGRLGL